MRVIHPHFIYQVFLVVLLECPYWIWSLTIIRRSVTELQSLCTSSQSGHIFQLQSDSTNKILEIRLAKHNLNRFFIWIMTLECIPDFEHHKEHRRHDSFLLILVLGLLPIGHSIPHNQMFLNWSLLKLLVIKVHDFEEGKELR